MNSEWIQGMLPNIPRVYTALAEWMACIVMINSLPAKVDEKRKLIRSSVFLVIQISFLYFTESARNMLWIVCMLAAVAGMAIFIYLNCDITKTDALFYCTIAFIYAEFAASAEWQVYCYIREVSKNTDPLISFNILVVIYIFIFGGAYFLIKQRYEVIEMSNFTRKEVIGMVLIGVLIFFLSNLGFIAIYSPFEDKSQMDIFSARTLIDFAGVAILCTYFLQKENMCARYDMQRLETIIENQYIQYKQSQETLDIINYKYHDLKHYIIVLRAEEDKEKREQYLKQLEEEIYSYEVQNKTGNTVLDTILTSKSMVCKKYEINLTVVVDGKALNFMKTLDICSIFGNALDNAIEYEKNIEEQEKRMIHVSVGQKKGFVIIKVQNYYGPGKAIEEKDLKTQKDDKTLHGFGVKSISHTAYKYNGEVNMIVQNEWFNLSILIPNPLESEN